MQYLLKVNLQNTNVWRLVAIDGIADRAFVGDLIALAFDYSVAPRSFIINEKEFKAGSEVEDSQELVPFNDFNLQEGDVFTYISNHDEKLVHDVYVMKATDKLYCFMPSCLVGSGHIPENIKLTTESINEYLDKEDVNSLDLRACTARMRAYGVQRIDAHKALITAGASDIKFNVE